jgi:hypothetical protein
MQLRLPSKAREAKGVVYTKPWVVDLILDLVGYRADADLATLVAVEPSAGEGAFLVLMVRRLLASLQLHGRSIEEAKRALLAYELDGEAAAWAQAGAPRVAVSRLGRRAAGISWPTSARKLAVPIPATPGPSQRSLVGVVGSAMADSLTR